MRLRRGQKRSILSVSPVGDRRSWAILTRNFSVENRARHKEKKKVAKKKEKRACGN